MNIENIIKTELAEGLNTLFNISAKAEEIILQSTKKEFEGTYTFTTFTYTKLTKVSPEETGNKLGTFLKEKSQVVSGFNVVKGFLNLVIAETAWAKLFQETISKENFGAYPSNGKKIMVEYSSPNTNKPLHLGHLRNNFLGFSVSEILKAYGYEVIKANLINDRGIHICKSMLAYQKFGNGETPESSGMKGDHLVGKYYVEFDKMLKAEAVKLKEKGLSDDETEKQNPVLKEAQEMLLKWEQGDKEVVDLWKKMNGWVYEGFDATYKMIGVDFDKRYYESNTYLLGKEIVEEGLQKGVFFKKENGSIWVDLTPDGLDEKLLLRADGTSVYITQDLGTAELKYKEFGCEKSIYVVGNEQDYHFNVLKLILKKLNKSYAEGVYHLSYGMVDLPSGKMKSREGTVVDADDLVNDMIEQAKVETIAHSKNEGFKEEEANKLYRQLGLGALKYYLLRVDPKKRMLFNPEESIQLTGDTGPYIQYTYARSRAIIRKATEQKIDYSASVNAKYTVLHPTEIALMIALNRFPSAIKEAAEQYSPALISQYCLELAREFGRFYTEVSIMMEPDASAKAFRIALTDTTGKVLKKAMGLLGVEVPEKM
jgi:arginyl-tRNA synthetase